MTKGLVIVFALFAAIIFIPIVIGITGGIIGGIFGIIAGVFGGIIGLIGGLFGMIGGLLKGIFHLPFTLFHWNFCSTLLITLILFIAIKSRKGAR